MPTLSPQAVLPKTWALLASTFFMAAETEQHGASSAMLLVWQNGHHVTLVVVQAKVTPSTFALREALIQQQQEQQAALASLAVLPGCNRTADMQYEFVVGLHVPPAIQLSGRLAHQPWVMHCAKCLRTLGLTAFVH